MDKNEEKLLELNLQAISKLAMSICKLVDVLTNPMFISSAIIGEPGQTIYKKPGTVSNEN